MNIYKMRDNCIQELENEVLCLQEKNKPTVDNNVSKKEVETR